VSCSQVGSTSLAYAAVEAPRMGKAINARRDILFVIKYFAV